LRYINVIKHGLPYLAAMATGFVYRCPNTGLNVQGWVADDPTEGEAEAFYQSVACTACARIHLIDPKTGRIVGADED
jgi:hypothetical protein